MNTKIVISILVLVMISCGKKESKSPLFADDQLLTISGTYANENGQPLANTYIHLQNLRRFGYIDYTSVAIAEAVASFTNLMMSMAWPFFPFHSHKTVNPADFYQSPNYFSESLKTNNEGKFSFKIRAGNFLRDAEGGINLVLNNQGGPTSVFGKFAFVVKEANSDLGVVKLNTLGGISHTEANEQLTLSWKAPQEEVVQYVVNFAASEDKTLLWSQQVDGKTTSLILPRAIFQNKKILVGIEAYYKFEEELKISSLTQLQEFNIENAIDSLAKNKLAKSDNVQFKIDSLTNGKVDDSSFFEAFNTQMIELDLEKETDVKTVIFYNLKLKSSGTFSVYYKLSLTEPYKLHSSYADRRFLVQTLKDGGFKARWIKFEFASELIDLQEIGLF